MLYSSFFITTSASMYTCLISYHWFNGFRIRASEREGIGA